MGIAEDLSDALAKDVIEAVEALDDLDLIDQVAKQLGASSQTMQEAFLTAVRVRLSEKRARKFLDARLSRALDQAKSTSE
ncbi:hypothetical protein [Thalassovita sp.]|uniref:hypothetical protein n=1 Tax=Thalassovita sp. TaxID=1979401 RepID=UPI002B26AA5D|nr:hypothetical protein [Thalassovita sp.]